jgi:SAM-dependent methyltransferase
MESIVIEKHLTPESVLASYDVVSTLYPRLPSLSLWRAWEHAAYQGLALREPALDVGCGDGQFFRLLWPAVSEVTGVDHDPQVVGAARQTGVYREVHLASADRLPVAPGSMASAFANCSLEHMDRLPDVLRSLHQSLRAESPFILSVITDKFAEWRTLSHLLRQVGDANRAIAVDRDFDAYHHHVNPLSPHQWMKALEEAGFEVEVHMPIVPEITTRLFLFIDQMWHLRTSTGETGDDLSVYLRSLPCFDHGFRQILAGVMAMEPHWTTGSGAVFLTRRKR